MIATLKQHGFSPKEGSTNKNNKTGTQGNGGRDRQKICYKCKKPGHLAKECPSKTNNGGNRGTGGNKPNVDTTYKYTLPAGEDPNTYSITKQGRTYKWYAKCNDGKGMLIHQKNISKMGSSIQPL
jgi:hypothetical protein